MSTLGTSRCSLGVRKLQMFILSSIAVHESPDINNINIMTSVWLLWHMPPSANKGANGTTWSENGFKRLTGVLFLDV